MTGETEDVAGLLLAPCDGRSPGSLLSPVSLHLTYLAERPTKEVESGARREGKRLRKLYLKGIINWQKISYKNITVTAV